MVAEAERLSAHVYLDDRPLGAYVADMDISVGHGPDAPRYAFEISLDELEGLRLHVQNAIDALRHRMLRDAIAGSCSKCKNTRMVDVVRHGRRTPGAEHCPICTPKIDAVINALREGHPPRKRAAKKDVRK